MARRGTYDRAKERVWRRMLRQWRRSGMSIRAFCSQELLSEPLFYAWRRTLAQRDQARRPCQQPPRRTGRSAEDPGPDVPAAFVPLHLLPAAATLEVVLGPHRLVRVPTGFDPATLRQLLAVLDETPPC